MSVSQKKEEIKFGKIGQKSPDFTTLTNRGYNNTMAQLTPRYSVKYANGGAIFTSMADNKTIYFQPGDDVKGFEDYCFVDGNLNDEACDDYDSLCWE